MEFFDVIQKRRSIRKFQEKPLPKEMIRKAFWAATLAPNSSNAQTWKFYWVRSPETKKQLVEACLNQSAARTASDLIVFTSNPKNYKNHKKNLIDWVHAESAPNLVKSYYEKFLPDLYNPNPIKSLVKKIAVFFIGLFRPIPRTPITFKELSEVAKKSCALGAQNFALAITAQGGSTCMMEGFDKVRVKKILKLKQTDEIAMIIAAGYESDRGTWGKQFRIPIESVLVEK